MNIINHAQEIIDSMNGMQLAGWGAWSYLLLAVLVAFEGPIATLLGAAAASTGLMHPGLVFTAAATGNLTADTLWYSLGYLGRLDWLMRLSKHIGLNPSTIERMEAVLRRHAPTILFVSKLTISPMIPALIATGLIKYPWKRWFPSVFAGEMIWTGALVLIGYFGLIAIKKVQLGIEHAVLAGGILFIILILWFGRRFLKGELQRADAGQDEPENAKG